LFSKPNVLKITGFVLLIGILVQALYDPFSFAKHSLEVSRVRAEFPQARAKWGASGITDYTFEIQGITPSICQVSAVIQVENDVVIKVETRDLNAVEKLPKLLSPDKWYDPDWGDEVFLCSYHHFTMSHTFDLLEKFTRSDPSTILQVDFDPAYGYITNFRYGLYIGNGLLDPKISECCSNFSIKNFQPSNGQISP